MHSWNSDYPLGRIFLFELSRHSDHHHIATRKYQVLRTIDISPQMPTGYPGMMILSLFPPAKSFMTWLLYSSLVFGIVVLKIFTVINFQFSKSINVRCFVPHITYS